MENTENTENTKLSFIDEFVQKFANSIQHEVLEEQKQYHWIRLYMNDELEIDPMTKVKMVYVPTSEEFDLVFTSYNKKKSEQDKGPSLVEYVAEDDKKVLSLLYNLDDVENSEKYPKITTLFARSKNYEFNLMRRDDLIFKLEDGTEITYYDIEF
jgi:hypothetical protein